MKIIGITGGIGTGKSTVLNILEKEYGAFIVETDKLAHQLMSPGEEAYQSTVETFGKDILCDDNTIDRGKLGSIVFNNKDMLCELNKIVHPDDRDLLSEDIKNIREGKSDIKDDWNYAYNLASTDYVTVAHQDDVYHKDYVKYMFAY